MGLNIDLRPVRRTFVGTCMVVYKIAYLRHKLEQLFQHVVQSGADQNLLISRHVVLQDIFNGTVDVHQEFCNLTIYHTDQHVGIEVRVMPGLADVVCQHLKILEDGLFVKCGNGADHTPDVGDVRQRIDGIVFQLFHLDVPVASQLKGILAPLLHKFIGRLAVGKSPVYGGGYRGKFHLRLNEPEPPDKGANGETQLLRLPASEKEQIPPAEFLNNGQLHPLTSLLQGLLQLLRHAEHRLLVHGCGQAVEAVKLEQHQAKGPGPPHVLRQILEQLLEGLPPGYAPQKPPLELILVRALQTAAHFRQLTFMAPDAVQLLDNVPQNAAQVGDINRFQEKVRYAKADGRLRVLKLSVASKDDNSALRLDFPDFRNQFQPVHIRHPDVRQHDVRLSLPDILKGLFPVRRHSHQGQAKGVPGERLGKSLPDQTFVVGKKYAIHPRSPSSRCWAIQSSRRCPRLFHW